MSPGLVSIVIPTWNGSDTLPALLDSVAAQKTEFDYEIVAVDSGSTDGTPEILESRVQRLIRIPPRDFNHGLTRNVGIAESRGELIVMLVQDAVPVSTGWLSTLTAPLWADDRLAGVYARQQPRPDASAVTRHHLERYAASSPVPRTAELDGAQRFQQLEPLERLALCTFDNVCSCLRRSVWKAVPFADTPIAEDIEWARDVLLAGFRLAYVPEAVVVHSHERSARYELNRTYQLHRRLHALLGLRTIPTLRQLLCAVALTLAAHVRCLASESAVVRHRQLGRAVALAVAFPLGQYLGGLAADKGWHLLEARGV